MRRLRKVGHDPGDQQRKRSADGESHEAKAESIAAGMNSFLELTAPLPFGTRQIYERYSDRYPRSPDLRTEVARRSTRLFSRNISGRALRRLRRSRPFVQDNLSRSGVRRFTQACTCSTQNTRESWLAYCAGGFSTWPSTSASAARPSVDTWWWNLSEDNHRQVWVPRGFAHGFVVLSQSADFFYKCDQFYSPADEVVVRWNDPALGIGWGLDKPKLSTRDAAAPLLAEIEHLPRYGQI